MSAVQQAAAQPPETICGLLYWGAQQWPERHFVTLPDDTRWTRGAALAEAHATALRFAAAGIAAGDRVFVMMPNGADWLRCWWGLALLGAVIVPINPAFRGGIFNDLFDRIQPKGIVVEPGSQLRFTPEQQGRLLFTEGLHQAQQAKSVSIPEQAPDDLHAIVLTSGTTGSSKGAMLSGRQLCRQAAWLIEGAGVCDKDVFLADLPLFHLGGLSPIALMMRTGGAFVLRVVPAMSHYWGQVRKLGVTFSYLAGTMAHFLSAQPKSNHDSGHGLRFIQSAPLPQNLENFKRRFGIEGITTCYGSTESSIVLVQPLDRPARAGSCGQLRDGYETRLVDAAGHDVAVGEIGELLIRNPTAGTMMLGYFGDSEATQRAWDGGWYHSGDLFRRDAQGYYYWQDRARDCLRRRGENISSFEVEREVLSYPGIAEAACVAQPSDLGGDDEVKVFVVPEAGTRDIDWRPLVQHLAERLPYFMVPRFFEQIDVLPKTPTRRVQKFLLRQRGNSELTWDRERHGLFIGRDGHVKTKQTDTVGSDK